MQRFIANTVIASLIALPVVSGLSAFMPAKNMVRVQLCASGQFIEIDLGGDNDKTPPVPSHKSNACHAICCKDYELGEPQDKLAD